MKRDNIYRSLGVTPIINAAGTFTSLGGSLMPPEVIAAWQQAAGHFVDLQELQNRVGQRIADLLHVPAAMVTGGAAHSILLGVASAVTRRYSEFAAQHSVVQHHGEPLEVLRQASHRDLYDRQIETCGVRIVEVTTGDDVARAVSNRTVLMMAYNVYEPRSAISHAEWLELAQQHSLPTFLDAAADVPPVENFSRYVDMGYDMVCFSGGKAVRGPQDSGLLVGQPKFIDLAKQNASPIEGTLGRVSKMSKEDIVALWRAVELFVEVGDSIGERCNVQLQAIVDRLSASRELNCQFITPKPANCFPHLCLRWDEAKLKITTADLAEALRHGDPPIATDRVYGTGEDGLLISAVNLQPGEEIIVAKRIAEVFVDRADS